jgi:ankyrin repeat protein
MVFTAESAEDKSAWLEALVGAFASSASELAMQSKGWKHKVLLGTIHSAALMGDGASLQKLLENVSKLPPQQKALLINDRDEEGCTGCHYAALYNNERCLALLLMSGADPNLVDNLLFTPLHIAASRCYQAIVKLLCEQGADVAAQDVESKTPLMLTAVNGEAAVGARQCLATLRHWGADVDALDCSGNSSLHEVIMAGQERIVWALIANGAAVDAKHAGTGSKPLHLSCTPAMSVLNEQVVKALLDAGAQPNFAAPHPMHGEEGLFVMEREQSGGSLRMTPLQLIIDAALEDGEGLTRWRRGGEDAVDDSGGGGGVNATGEVSLGQQGLLVAKTLVSYGARLPEHICSSSGSATAGSNGVAGGGTGALRPSLRLVSTDLAALQGAAEVWADKKAAALKPDKKFEWAEGLTKALVSSSKFVPDSASSCCLLCGSNFSLTRRRHHCRRCKTLLCAPCSTKQAVLQFPNAGDDTKKQDTGGRVCDGCFNLANYTVANWSALQAASAERGGGSSSSPSGSTQSQAAGGGRLTQENEQKRRDREREALLARAGGKDLPASAKPSGGRSSPTAGGAAAGAQNGLGAIGAQMAESHQRVAERGEKIKDLAQKTERMNLAANGFAQQAAALRRQQESSSWFS